MQPSQRRPRLLASPARAQQLLAWQGCSVLLTATGFTSQRLAERGIAAPTAQSLAVYLVLMLHALTARRDNRVAGLPPVARPWWQWLLLGFADVEGNYLIVRAYQYTDITSVTLLDAFAVPGVMALSALTLGARYGRKQICGVAFCISGLATLVMSDALLRPMHSWHPQPWRGDVLCLLGASLYACSNVAEEAFLRSSSVSNYLPRLGAAGALLSAAQCALIERGALASAWRAFSSASLAGRTELLLLELLFVGSMASFYSLVSHLLQRGATAAEMNISLLTSDFWSVLAGVALLGSRLTWWYPPAFVATLSGLVLYYHRPAPSAARQLTEPLNARPRAAAPAGAMEEGGAGLREGEGEAGHRADAAARAGGQPDGRVE